MNIYVTITKEKRASVSEEKGKYCRGRKEKTWKDLEEGKKRKKEKYYILVNFF